MESSNLSSLLNWLLTAAGALGGLATLYYGFINRVSHELEDQESLAHYRQQLAAPPLAARYKALLRAALERAEAFFGKPFSWQALNVCWLIAFVYPLFLFLVTWALGGPHTLGALELLPAEWARWQRLLFILALGGYFYAVFLLARHGEQVEEWFNHRVVQVFARLPGRRWCLLSQRWKRALAALPIGIVLAVFAYLATGSLAFAGAVVFVAGAGAVAFVVAFAGAGAVAFFVAFAVVVAFAGAGAGAFVFAVAVTFAVAFAGAGALAFAFAFAGAGAFAFAVAFAVTFAGVIAGVAYLSGGWMEVFQADTISFVLFLLVLPLLNGLLDFVSWAASRTLGRLLLRHGRYTGLLLVLVDAALALLLLGGLVWVLCAAAAGVNRLALAKTGTPALDLEGLLNMAVAEPFGAGFWITAMLFSTLLPTVLHLAFAVGSAFALREHPDQRAHWRERIDAVLADGGGALSRVDRRRIGRYLFFHRWLGAVALTGLLLACLIWFGSRYVLDLSDVLLSIAASARAVVGG